MKIISLNIRRLGSAEKRSRVKELCVREKPSMIGLQETKQRKWGESQMARIWGFDDGDFVQKEATGNSGGLMIIWDSKEFKADFVIEEKNFVAVIGKWKDVEGLVGCVNVYGPRDLKERVETWKKLEMLCEKEDVKWCLFGDFDEVRSEQERLNSVTNIGGT